MTRTSVAARIGCLLACLCAATGAHADKDIHYLAEHVVESGMDARYMALPWPSGRLETSAWQPSVDFASTTTTTHFMQLNGSMIAAAVARGVNARWGYELTASYGNMTLSGEDGSVMLTRGYLDAVPLDLPQLGSFSAPHGIETLFGLSAAGVRELGGPNAVHSSQLIVGALVQHENVDRFQMGYRLTSGADAGAVGTLEYDSGATLVTPFVGWQQTRTLTTHWTWSPRAMFLAPQPRRAMVTRMTGPGFDLSTQNAGPTIVVGDGFVTLGLALRHRPSGLEVDLGGLLYYAVGEGASHPGVSNARVLHVAWRH